MILIDDALTITLDNVSTKPAIERELEASIGYVSAEPLCSTVDLPPFDQSAMDGYALVQADIANASPDQPVTLTLIGEMAAGASPDALAVQRGQCARIFTGGPVPEGATAVVKQEDVEAKGDQITFRIPVDVGNNVRTQGEELSKGHQMLPAGKKLTPGIVASLSAAGLTHAKVYEKPSVAVLVTGDEVVQAGEPLPPGAIYDANTPMLKQYLAAMGCENVSFVGVKDTLEGTVESLKQGIENYDVVVTTGGVSVGDKDFIIPAAESLGVEQKFWRIRQKPGKPVYFGIAPNGVPVLGLPGNPAAVLVGTVVYLARLLATKQGLSVENFFQYGVLAKTYQPDKKRDCWVRCTLEQDAVGRALLTPLGFQASHMLSNLGEAHVLAWLPASENPLVENTVVKWVAL